MQPEEPRARSSAVRKVFDTLTILLFLALIAAPSVDNWIRPDSARGPTAAELRNATPRPPPPDTLRTFAKYPATYEAYFKDSFGLRDVLLRANSIIKVFGFGVSPSSEVYFAKQGWLFYTGESSRENHRGVHPFKEREIARWAEALEKKRAMLAEMGIRYMYVVAPDKETVYAELQPAYMRPLGPTRLEQFLAYMKEHAPAVEILDLSATLIAAKRDDAPGDWVYGNLGTHWTGRGSHVVLRTLLERIDQLVGGVEPTELDAYQRVEFDTNGDSWTTRMYIGDLLSQETSAYIPAQTQAKVRMEGKFRIGRIRKSELEDSTRPRVLMMHDSFGVHIEKGLAEQCSYLECRWDTTIDALDIKAAAPAVFIDMYVERILNHFDPNKLLPTQGFSWAARYNSSERKLVSLDRTRSDWGATAVGDAIVGPAVTTPRPRLPVLTKGGADGLEFPSLVPIEGEIPVLHLWIDTAVETELVLAFKPPGARDFASRGPYRKRLEAGSNDFYIPLDRAGTRGELQLRPGDRAGKFALREFEIRSVPADP